MKLKIVIASSVIGIALHLACDTGTNPCGPFPSQFDVQSYLISLTPATFGAPALDTAAIYSYDSLAIRISPVVEYLYTYSSTHNCLIMPVAYACSPVLPFSIDTLEEITIVTDADYDSTFLAGDTLNSMLTVNSLGDQHGSRQMPLTDFLNSRPSVKRDMFLTLDFPPTQPALYRFTVHVKHVSEEEFQFITQSIMIRP